LPLSAEGVRVVSIGSATYVSDDLPDVPAVARTVTDLSELFVERCGVRRDLLTVLVDPESTDEIGAALAAASDAATDVLLVYFAGHGLVHSSGELYLAHSRTSSDPGHIAFSALRYPAVRECLLNSRARSLHVILDCCFAGRAIGTLAPSDVVNTARVDGASVLAAAARDELALAPAEHEHTAFTGAMISYLREGDPDGSPYISMRDVYRHLSIALPSASFPAPQFMTNQNADDLVLCANQAVSGPEGDAIDVVPDVAAQASHKVGLATSLASSIPGLGAIVHYEGWADFNPLPAALMDVDSRVPRTADQLAEILDEWPPSWESRVFAGTALLELARLRPLFARHFRGPILPQGSERSGQAAFEYIKEELGNFEELVRALDGIVEGDRHSRILASENPVDIQSHAREFIDLLERLMSFADRLRSTVIKTRHLRRSADILAHFSDQPIVSITQFIQRYTSELDQTGARIMQGEDLDIRLTIKVDIPQTLSEEFTLAVSKY